MTRLSLKLPGPAKRTPELPRNHDDMNGLLMTGLTDPGRLREQNEDSIACVPPAGLAVVADGMGGHKAGEVASKLAVDIITRHIIGVLSGAGTNSDSQLESKMVSDAIQLANRSIFELAQQQPDYAGMGSTVVVVVFHGDKLCVGHVGDSRLYRFHHGILEQITQDHSVVQELVNRGLATAEEARVAVNKNLVTRALGVDAAVTPDISEEIVSDEDIFLLCSDGLNDVLADGDIELMLTEHQRHLDTAAKQMVDIANERGGPDNISVILVRANCGFKRNLTELQKLRDSA
jgi:serine/threonine protein phosphatase PrpC